MKEHLQDDKLEEFLRNKLNEFDGEPNNNMWDRVEGVIPPAPKPVLFRIMKPSAIAASIVFAIAVSAAVYQYSSKQNLNNQLIEATDKIKKLEHQIGEETLQLEEVEKRQLTLEKNLVEEENSSTNENKSSNTENKSTNNQTKTNSNKSNSSTIINNGKQIPIANNKNDKDKLPLKNTNNNQLDKIPIAEDNKIMESNDNNIIGNEPKNPLLKENADKNIVLSEPFLLDRIRNDEIDNYAYFVMVEQKPLTSTPTFNPQLIVGGFTYAFQTRPKFQENPGPPPPGGNPFKDHRVKPATGIAIGAKVGLQLNKNWSIHSGLAYQRDKIKMKLVDHRDYQQERENDIGNNQESYQTNYMTYSPFGELRVSGEFTKNKDDNIEEKPFDIEVGGTHQLTSLNIPLYLQVQNQKGRFIYGAKAGIYGRSIISNAFDATEITSSISELKASEVTIVEQPNITTKWAADFLYGAVLAYQQNQNLTFSFEPTGLISISKEHKSPYGNTRITSLGVQLGAQYAF